MGEKLMALGVLGFLIVVILFLYFNWYTIWVYLVFPGLVIYALLKY